MTLAYIHSAEKILIKVYLKVKPEFQLTDSQLLEILLQLYVMDDSEDYWHSIFLKPMKSDSNMQISVWHVTIL